MRAHIVELHVCPCGMVVATGIKVPVVVSFPIPRPLKVKCPACDGWMVRRELVPAPEVEIPLPPVPKLEAVKLEVVR